MISLEKSQDHIVEDYDNKFKLYSKRGPIKPSNTQKNLKPMVKNALKERSASTV